MIVKPNRDRKAERHEAIRREILDAAWDAAHETSIAGLTLRDIAARVGMQQPSLYSHFASKQAIYDAMFEQAWQAFLAYFKDLELPAEPRARLTAMAEHYFDFAVTDLARHQLMDMNIIPGFHPSPQAYARAVEVYGLLLDDLRSIGITHGPGRRHLHRAHQRPGLPAARQRPGRPAVAPPDPQGGLHVRRRPRHSAAPANQLSQKGPHELTRIRSAPAAGRIPGSARPT